MLHLKFKIYKHASSHYNTIGVEYHSETDLLKMIWFVCPGDTFVSNIMCTRTFPDMHVSTHCCNKQVHVTKIGPVGLSTSQVSKGIIARTLFIIAYSTRKVSHVGKSPNVS